MGGSKHGHEDTISRCRRTIMTRVGTIVCAGSPHEIFIHETSRHMDMDCSQMSVQVAIKIRIRRYLRK